jgi:superoxide dismutase, Fe-Mn family
MPFEVPPLPYDYAALEPHIDEQTMRLHHDKHHQTYVDKLNAALAGTEHEGRSIDDIVADLDSIPEDKRTAVRNHGGGHLNHSKFWEWMSPDGGGDSGGELGSAIESAFGSLDDFRSKFEETGANQFGSGWVWLVLENGSLSVLSTANQDSPLSKGQVPILGNDVWEHAYYLKYQNRRPEYLKAWWNVVDWEKVADLYAKGG